MKWNGVNPLLSLFWLFGVVKRRYGAVVTQHYDIGYWIMIMMMMMLNLSCCVATMMPTTNKEKAQLVMKSEKYDSIATITIVLWWWSGMEMWRFPPRLPMCVLLFASWMASWLYVSLPVCVCVCAYMTMTDTGGWSTISWSQTQQMRGIQQWRYHSRLSWALERSLLQWRSTTLQRSQPSWGCCLRLLVQRLGILRRCSAFHCRSSSTDRTQLR